MTTQYSKLLQRLDLKQNAKGQFIGGSGAGGVTADNRLYGGLVVSQAVVAAARSAPTLHLHSMHAYFLRPGRPDTPILFTVDEIKRGRRYHARQVQATQGDAIIFQMLASFGEQPTLNPQGQVTHSNSMPEVPDPEGLLNRDQARGRKNWQDATIDVRLCDALTETLALPPTKSVWIKPVAQVPTDPIQQLALLTFASDRAFLSTAWRPHADVGRLHGASLDHSLWIHAPIRFDDWHLYHSHSPAAAQGRGLVHGAIYNRQGQRVASVAQEGTLSYKPH